MTSLIFAIAFPTEILMLLVIKDGPSQLCLYRAKKRTPPLRHWRWSSSLSPANQFPCPFTIFPFFDTELWWPIVNFLSSFAKVAVMEVLKKNFSSYSAGKCSDCCSGSCSRECSCNQKSIQSPRITTEKTHWTIFMFWELFMVTCFSGSVSPSVPDIASQHEALGTGSLHSSSHLNDF